MKMSKKLLCIVLVFIMLFDLSSVSFAIFDDIDKGIWDKTWESRVETTESAVTMFVGNDENDRTIAWYSDAEEGYVELKNIKGSEKINATAKKTAEGDYRLCVALTDLEAGIYTYKCFSDDFESDFYTFTMKELLERNN